MTPTPDDEAARKLAVTYSFEYGSLMEAQVDIAAAFEAGYAERGRRDAEEIERLKRDWNAQAKNWNIQTLRDSAEIQALRRQLAIAREALEEMSLPPYPDSDLMSLLTTLRARARAAFGRMAEGDACQIRPQGR